jgi:hypothetical protein
VAEKPQHGLEVLAHGGSDGQNLIAAAITGLLVAGMWPAFDESAALLLRLFGLFLE